MLQDQEIRSLIQASHAEAAGAIPTPLRKAAIAGLSRIVRSFPECFSAYPLESFKDEREAAMTEKEFASASRGNYTSHPLTVALARLSAMPSEPAFTRVVAHFVLACITYELSDDVAFAAAKYAACLALRRVMQFDDPPLLADWLGNHGPLDLHDHRLNLDCWKVSKEIRQPEFQRAIEDLERAHAFLADHRKPHPGQLRGTRTKLEANPAERPAAPAAKPPPAPTTDSCQPTKATGPRIPRGRNENDERDDLDSKPSAKPRALISAKRRIEAVRDGEPAAEGAQEFELAGDENAGERLPGRPFALPRQRLPAGHFVVRARRTAAQHLVFADPALIRRPDLQLLLSCIGEASTTVKAVIAAAMYGGQAIDRMLGWRVQETAESMDTSASASVVVLNPLGLLVPLLATKDLPASQGDALTMAPSIFLPMDVEWRGMSALRARAIRRAGQTLFEPDDIAAAESFFRSIRSEHTTALTMRRLCGLLPQRIRQAHDAVLEALLTGVELNGPESSRLHYLQTTALELADVYVCMARQLNRDLEGTDSIRPVVELPVTGIVGSQRVPDEKAVQAWVAELIEKVGTPPRGRPSLARVFSFHDRFTAYVVEHQLFASGARPHGKTMQSLAPVCGVLLVDEKDKGVEAVRQIPMTRLSQALWQRYMTHRSWVMSFLGIEQCPMFFSLNGQGKVRSLSLAQVRATSGRPFSANSNRHFFCTSLRRAGLSGDEVSALMGHTCLGEETGNRYGALDVRWLHGKAERAIDQWLPACGWKVLEGFGRG